MVFVVSSHKLFVELLREEERNVLVEQMKKRSATVNLSTKPLPSFYDIPGAFTRFLCPRPLPQWRTCFFTLPSVCSAPPQLLRPSTSDSWSSSSSCHWIHARSDRFLLSFMAWLKDLSGRSTARWRNWEKQWCHDVSQVFSFWLWLFCCCCFSSQWEVPPDYINVILSIKDNLTKDLVYILMAKGLHCISIKVVRSPPSLTA